MADAPNPELLELTAKIVAVHVGQNHLPVEALPELIQSVYRSLASAGTTEPAAEPQTPAVAVRKSVFPDYLVCLEDGRKLKMLKRYLRISYGMTPDQYRQKWNLPASYPMVAPNYASRRSDLAKQNGLGRLPARTRRAGEPSRDHRGAGAAAAARANRDPGAGPPRARPQRLTSRRSFGQGSWRGMGRRTTCKRAAARKSGVAPASRGCPCPHCRPAISRELTEVLHGMHEECRKTNQPRFPHTPSIQHCFPATR